MRTVTYRLADLSRAVIPLGFVGENQHTRVIFDAAKVFAEYPAAVPALTVQPPQGTSYPAVVVRDGDYVHFDVSDSDLIHAGTGELQLAFVQDTVKVRTFIARTRIDRSIVPTGEIPEPLEDFLEAASAAVAAIPQEVADGVAEGFGAVTAEAETLAAGSDATAEFDTATKVLTIGVPVGADGQDGAPGADGFSPVASVTKSGDTATISITDKTGTTTATVKDGTDGQDGQPGADGYSPSASVSKSGATATITITDKSGTTTATVSDGTPVIDDTTTTATDKVWSAKKSADTASDLNTAIDAKQDADITPKNASSDAENVDLDITDESGNVLVRFADGHIQTKGFNSKASGESLKEDGTTDDLNIVDNFGNVILRIRNGHIHTKNFDSSYVTPEAVDEIDGRIDILDDEVADLQSATSGIVYRNNDMNDGVYAACRWHQPSGADHQFCLLLSGDIHADTARMSSIIDYLNAIDCFDAGIMLGDIAAWDKDATWYTSAIEKSTKPFLTLVGNHDVSNTTGGQGYEYIHDVYEKYYEPNLQYADLASGEHESENTYYYKDFSSRKIRMIMLNDYEYPSDKSGGTLVYQRGDRCYSQDQIDWLIETLNDTPSDYGVIIAAHFWPGGMSVQSSNILTASTYGNTFTPHSNISQTNGFVIEDIVNAWINGTTLSKTYDYTVSGTFGTGIEVDADFTERGAGEFITYISGHWHMSVVAKTTNYGQASYTVAAAGLNAETQSDQPRRSGTRSEDHFAALAIDRDLKTVKIIQIGAHFSKDGVDRLYGQYSYSIS